MRETRDGHRERRPLWLLDVDGVLNANKPGWGGAPHRRDILADGVFWKIRWAPALATRIRALHRSSLVEIRWATSWIGNTAPLAAALALPDFEPAYPNPAPGQAHTDLHNDCKQGAAFAVLCSGRRLIWTDDEAIPAIGPLADALADAVQAGGALAIAPRPNRGLQPGHLDAIEAFIEMPTTEGE